MLKVTIYSFFFFLLPFASGFLKNVYNSFEQVIIAREKSYI